MAGRGTSKTAPGVARAPAPKKPRGPVGLDTPIGESGFVGALALRRAGSRLGIRTVRDLLFHLPRRYDDLRELSTARDLYRIEEGERASARLQIRGIKVVPTFRRHIERTTVYLGDDTGDVEATWFGRRYIANRIKEGQWIVISGKIRRRGFTTSFDNADFQADDGSELLHAGRIVPVYRLSAGLTATTLRRAIRQALDTVGGSYPEYLPAAGFGSVAGSAEADRDAPAPADGRASAAGGGRPMPIAAALENAHYPEDFVLRDAALSRLGFDELLALQIGMVARDRQRRRAVGEPVAVEPERAREAVALVEAAITDQVQARTGSTRSGAADSRPGDRRSRHRVRPGPIPADDAAAAGRRGLGQDRGGRPGPGVRRRRGPPGRAACPDRSARPPARGGVAAPREPARPRGHVAHGFSLRLG